MMCTFLNVELLSNVPENLGFLFSGTPCILSRTGKQLLAYYLNAFLVTLLEHLRLFFKG